VPLFLLIVNNLGAKNQDKALRIVKMFLPDIHPLPSNNGLQHLFFSAHLKKATGFITIRTFDLC
jgi:hypothetical protein